MVKTASFFDLHFLKIINIMLNGISQMTTLLGKKIAVSRKP